MDGIGWNIGGDNTDMYKGKGWLGERMKDGGPGVDGGMKKQEWRVAERILNRNRKGPWMAF